CDAGPLALLACLMAHHDNAAVAVFPLPARVQPNGIAELGPHDGELRIRQLRADVTVIVELGSAFLRKSLGRGEVTRATVGERTVVELAAVADAEDFLPGRRNRPAQCTRR